MKLYNVFFPIWVLIFLPPMIFGALAINYIVDTAVLLLCLLLFRRELSDSKSIISTYKMTIIWVWLVGFFADFVGAIYLYIVGYIIDWLEVDYTVAMGIVYNPFDNFMSFAIVASAVGLSAWLIYLLNSRFVLRRYLNCGSKTYQFSLAKKKYRVTQEFWISKRIALIIGLVTAPWTFLIPFDVFAPLF